MTVSDPTHFRAILKAPLFFAGVLFAVELLVIGTIFKHGIDFTCLDNWPGKACRAASGSLVALYCVIAALALFVLLRPLPFRTLLADAGARLWPLAINGAGVAIALIPLLLLNQGDGTAALLPSFAAWSAGMAGILLGLGLFLAPLSRWKTFAFENGGALLFVTGVGAVAPQLATLIRPIWRIDTIAEVTFLAVTRITEGLGYDVVSEPEAKVIGAGDFFIDIAPQCSGIEGIALVTLFVTMYLVLFRQDLRFPRVLLLYPIGILTSALFNIVRIAVLLIIGLEGNPELAIGGFHGHAGWLMFTLIAVGIVALAQTVPALQKAPQNAGPKPLSPLLPWREDPAVAFILPFAVFMLSALLAQAFSQTPSLVYPARVVLMAGVLVLFWHVYRALPWRVSGVAVAAGVVIAVGWIWIPVETPDDAAPYGALTGAALLGWFALRGLGTTVLVPIIEEVFFRGYLEKRLRLGSGMMWTCAAALVSAALFAALHGRWAEAFVAGLIFSWVARRRDNITDAIVAHGVANGLIYATALATNQMHII